MNKYTITEKQRGLALLKMELSPYSLINDSINHRAGYIRALLDLGMIDGLLAARMVMKVESMEGWEEER